MNKEVERLKRDLYEFTSQNVIFHWRKSIEARNKALKELLTKTDLFHNKLSHIERPELIFNEYLDYYNKILDLITEKALEKAPLNNMPDFDLLYEKIEAVIENVPERVKEEQLQERFSIQPENVFTQKILKSLKIAVYRLSTTPLKLFNIIRILLRKQPVRIRFWYHRILLRSLISHHFKHQFIKDLVLYRNDLNKTLATAIGDLWEYLNSTLPDESYNLDKKGVITETPWDDVEGKINHIEQICGELINDLDPKLKEIIDNRVELFLGDYSLAGTLEYSNRKLKENNVQKSIKKTELLWEVNSKDWGNTFFAIFDDWKSDLEIYTLRNKLITETYHIGRMQNSDEYRFRKEFAGVNSVFEEAIENLRNPSLNLRKALLETKYSIVKNLSKNIIPAFTERISSRNFSGLINKLENTIEISLEGLSDSHIVVKSENYSRPLKSNELETISISDLTSFEMLPKLRDTLTNIRNLLFIKLAEVNESVLDLDNIVIFAIETTITHSENQGTIDSESLKIALEGIERAKQKLRQISNSIDSLYQNNYDDILKSILDFNTQLKSYTNNENVLNLKVRIVKSIAIEQSKTLRKEFRRKAYQVLRYSGINILNVFKYLYDSLIRTRNRFLLTAPKPVLSREVSDFLAYSNKKIDSLPLLYRSLYRIQPIRDKELFVGREYELSELRKAYTNWMGGNYAATVLIGEKWGGMTSLLSNFLDTNNFNYRVYRIIMNERIIESEVLISKISKELGVTETNDLETLIESLNALSSKRIIVLEDIQKIYLRKVNGFGSLKMLFKLINNTHKNIFWLASCTIYAWNYLRNAISIHDYFSHLILMEKLNEEEIVEIIKKRNRISGLNVIFEPEDKKSIQKKIKGLPEEDKQVLLQKMYFDELGDFSESNISLALLFWLLSTKEITENKLIVGHFQKPDLSFVKVISMDRVMTLLALILHDGLSESELSDVSNITLEESKFIILMLLEDGIIYQENNVFLINPLIYRNVIKLLQSKNLIH